MGLDFQTFIKVKVYCYFKIKRFLNFLQSNLIIRHTYFYGAETLNLLHACEEKCEHTIEEKLE